MEIIRKWRPELISDKKWRESLYYGKPELETISKLKRLYKKTKKNFQSRLKEDKYWKHTNSFRKHKKSLQEVKDLYAKYFAEFILHPEMKTVSEQNKRLGGFSMRSSFVSLGIVPDVKGCLFIHDKYKDI